MNIILYRGGMCGDIIAAMIDPTIFKKRIFIYRGNIFNVTISST